VRPNARAAPPLGLVAPFLLCAPLGLLVAGVLFATAEADSLAGINAPRNVAATHAAVIGGLTTAIMGAVYQLGPAVLGGRLVSERLARFQFAVHAVSVPAFVWALLEWNATAMGFAAVGLLVSFTLFLVNAFPAVGAFRRGSTVTRAYLSVALLLLIVTAGFGVTWVATLERLWFPVTLGRLSGHAHLGLLGWLGLAVMGVSYQLVPMFNVVQQRQPRFAWWVLGITGASALIGGLALMTDPGREVRVAITLTMSAGPALWGVDMLRLLLGRSRRHLDVQGRATFISLGFLAATIALGIGLAASAPGWFGVEPSHWQLAYAIAGIGGWLGITLLGNSYKILPFLVWYHRYRRLAGRAAVPMIGDIYNERWANTVLGGFAVAILVMAAGAAAGSLPALQAGGAALAAASAAHFATLAHVVLAPHHASSRHAALGKVALQ
jgi:hypothetical protein